MNRKDPLIWIIPFMLSALGIVVILSLTSVRLSDGSLSFSLGKKQAQWMLFAWIVMIVGSAIPLSFWRNKSGVFLGISWLLVWLPLIPGLGVGGGGALRWLRIGPVTVQPLELLAFFLVIHLCGVYARRELKPFRAFILSLLLVGVLSVPVLLQPDLGGTLLLFFLAMGMYVGAYGLLLPLSAAVLLSPVFVFLAQRGYRQRRIVAWIDPWSDPADAGYQAIQGFVAFANGGLWGTGLGRAVQRSRFLPAAHTDFIFAALSETLGVWGSIGVLSLFLLWFFRIYSHFIRCNDRWICLVLWGLSLSIAVPLSINVAGITNLLPMTGMPLPFVSYGGSALVVAWLKTGLIIRAVKEMGCSL